MTYINEANLYKCIFQSRKPEAEKFQDWVYEEVLPSIRKHGVYATPQTIDNLLADPDNAIKTAIPYLKSTLLELEKKQKYPNKEWRDWCDLCFAIDKLEKLIERSVPIYDNR